MEVEIKLVCKDSGQLKRKLLALGAILEKNKHQIDTYYDHPNQVLADKGEYLRIRESGGKLTLAHHINLSDGVNDECEIVVEGNAEVEKFLRRLGFPKLGIIDKKREKYQLGEFSFCIDSVKNIGDFLEIEVEAEDDFEEAKEKCWQLAEKLGFTKKDKFGYWLCDIAVGKVKWPK